MKKRDLLKATARHLNFIKENNLLSLERKLDQGYGVVLGIGIATNDKYFDDISAIWDLWRMAMHPAYNVTYNDFENKYL